MLASRTDESRRYCHRISDLGGLACFIAGTTGFVDDCVAAAQALGAKPTLIHTEGFFTQGGLTQARRLLPVHGG